MSEPTTDPPADPTPPGPTPTPEPPPAAKIVVTGEKTERELQLEKDLETERQAKKKVELDNAQLQDKVHRLSTPPAPADPPAPRKRGPLGVRV
jgi:hypothetical protein